MCSCLVSFPGFIRYHLPLLRSILSFLRSSLRTLNLSRQLERSSHPGSIHGSTSSSTKRLATKDIKVTLGSQINGRGRFLNPGSVVATDADLLPHYDITRNSPTHADSAVEITRRENYERRAEEQHSRVPRPPSLHDQCSQRSQIQVPTHPSTEVGLLERGGASRTKDNGDSDNAWWNICRQPNTTHTDYWDVMSLFRSNTTTSPSRSKTHSGGDESAV